MNRRFSLTVSIALVTLLVFCTSIPSPFLRAAAAAPDPPEPPETGSPNQTQPADPAPQIEYDEWTVELHPVSSASLGYTHQGYLQHHGLPADGSYDLQVSLYASASGDTLSGETITYEDVSISAGAFTLALDWDSAGQAARPAWVEIGVRPGSSDASDPFTVISRRLPLISAGGLAIEPSPSAPAIQPESPLAPGDFTSKAPSPVPLICVTSDPTTGLIYTQEDGGTGFYVYDPNADAWTPLASAPLYSGNNGGAAYLEGKIYTVYTENDALLGVYDIASDTWSTITNGLGSGTGVIATNGYYLYLAVGTIFTSYDPVSDSWYTLAVPSIDIQPWGGMAYWNGKLYAHRGNGYTDFARYEIATNSWTTLTSLPDGAVLGSAIDPVGRVYYAYGSYWGTNWYVFDLDYESWNSLTIPLFYVNDGGMAYINLGDLSGIYFVQGEIGTGFARMETVPFVVGDFTFNGSSPVRLTSVVSDPTTGLIYAQENGGTDFFVYNPAVNTWMGQASSPLNSGNNGGAAYLEGKIYTVYTGNATDMGIYDINSNSWSTVANGLGSGTGVIASDGTYLYLAVGTSFKRFDPGASAWADLAAPSIYIEPWGGMDIWNGALYAHSGNGDTGFAKYEIATDSWTTLPSLPDGAVLGSAIDPIRRRYYAYGTYEFPGPNTYWYVFDLESESWSTETIPFFGVNDGGKAYVGRTGIGGVYFVQGEDGTGFARYQDATPSTGGFSINNGAIYANTTTVALNILAEDPQTGISHMRFRNEAPWKALLFQDAFPWDNDSLQQVLALNSLPYDQLDSSAIATTDLASYIHWSSSPATSLRLFTIPTTPTTPVSMTMPALAA